MFKKISEQIGWKSWEQSNPRYQRLHLLDLLQDGKFYDHLPYSFYDETKDNGDYIRLIHRRPSARYNICGMISKMVARKLFAGRHAPRLLHPDPKVASAIKALIEEAELPKKIHQLAVWGAVGAAAMTFKIVKNSEDGGKLICCVWRAKYCKPFFDENGNLSTLRIQYVVPATELLNNDIMFDNMGEEIKADDNYWFCMDHMPEADVTYWPVKVDAPPEERKFVVIEDPDWSVMHDIGLTQAHWFENLSGGTAPDGAATFEAAIPMSIEIDYTLSQLGAAIRYNASPQLLIIGDIRNGAPDGTLARSPSNTLHMKAAEKLEEGIAYGAGDAKLLEMAGNGIKTGLEYVDTLRKLALEQISAVRKDPEQLKGALAAKAMELIDEEFIDLVHELRTSYGEGGYLPLVKKMAKVAKIAGHPLMENVEESDTEKLTLQWPRMYTPGPMEVQQLAAGLAQLVEGGILDKQVAGRFFANAVDLDAPTTTEQRQDEVDTEFKVPDGVPTPLDMVEKGADGNPIDLSQGTSTLPGNAKDYGSKSVNA